MQRCRRRIFRSLMEIREEPRNRWGNLQRGGYFVGAVGDGEGLEVGKGSEGGEDRLVESALRLEVEVDEGGGG